MEMEVPGPGREALNGKKGETDPGREKDRQVLENKGGTVDGWNPGSVEVGTGFFPSTVAVIYRQIIATNSRRLGKPPKMVVKSKGVFSQKKRNYRKLFQNHGKS